MKNKFYTIEDVKNLSSETVFSLYHLHLNSNFAELLKFLNCDITFVGAKGCTVTDKNGNIYLDFLGGFGSFNIGHHHPRILETISQLEYTLNLVHTGFNPYTAALSANLSMITDDLMTRFIFCSSGAETVDSALKLARLASGKSKFIYCSNSYHGKTFGVLTVTGRNYYKDLFKPLLPECEEVEYDDLVSLEKMLQNNNAAAFIMEPIQGEGGIIIPDEQYLRSVSELCSKYETLLIVDEIQTGLGRTGSMFAFELAGITPDLICLGKSLGGGIMPVGVVMMTDKVYDQINSNKNSIMMTSSTFGGNSYACAVAISTLEVIRNENLAAQAKEKGLYLFKELNKLKDEYEIIKEVRGKGLLIGIEFHERENLSDTNESPNDLQGSYAAYIACSLLNEHLILTAYSLNNIHVIRLEPPLTISYEQINKFLQGIKDILEKKKGNRYYG